MPQELTGTEMQKAWITYLSRESETHKRDIQRAEGKVTEIDELLTRVQNTCKFCGEYIYKYSDEDRMGEHVKAKHSEPESELSQG